MVFFYSIFHARPSYEGGKANRQRSLDNPVEMYQFSVRSGAGLLLVESTDKMCHFRTSTDAKIQLAYRLSFNTFCIHGLTLKLSP